MHVFGVARLDGIICHPIKHPKKIHCYLFLFYKFPDTLHAYRIYGFRLNYVFYASPTAVVILGFTSILMSTVASLNQYAMTRDR